MGFENLSALFDEHLEVETSAGSTLADQLDTLAPLSPDETPSGFDSWAEKRRREFRSGRHHARRALTRAGGPPSPILRDVEGVPVFPPGFRGSITHTGKKSTFAAAVVARGKPHLGLDAEGLRDLPLDMVEHILSDSERKKLSAQLTSGPPLLIEEGRRALLAFSAKEAFYKCIFPSLRCRLEFHDVEFSITRASEGGRPGEFVVELLREDVSGAPASLPGRYMSDDKHVVCGVSWIP